MSNVYKALTAEEIAAWKDDALEDIEDGMVTFGPTELLCALTTIEARDREIERLTALVDEHNAQYAALEARVYQTETRAERAERERDAARATLESCNRARRAAEEECDRLRSITDQMDDFNAGAQFAGGEAHDVVVALGERLAAAERELEAARGMLRWCIEALEGSTSHFWHSPLGLKLFSSGVHEVLGDLNTTPTPAPEEG